MRRYFRAYPAISSRQQGADRLVYTEDDLRKVLWQAVDPKFEGERPSTIRLAADIYLTKPIELGAYQYNVTIDGAGRYAIAQSELFSGGHLFGLPSGTISDIDFDTIRFKVTTVAVLFNGDSGTIVNDFNFRECFVEIGGFTQMFQEDVSVLSANIDLDDFPPAHSFVLGPGVSGGSGTFTGTFSVGPYLSQWESLVPIFSRTSTGVGCKTESPNLALDVNGGFAIQGQYLELEGADPVITVGDRSLFSLSVNNITATGTIQITSGYYGQILVLYFSNASLHLTLDDNSTVDVNKNHVAKKLTQNETVTFIYVNGKWREICRSENT
jgi:hypothetical protein